MNLMSLTKVELLEKCQELNITKCKSKNKTELITLINKKIQPKNIEITINETSNKNTKINQTHISNIEFILEDENEDEQIYNNEIINNLEDNYNVFEEEFVPETDSNLKFIDLFCGIGGFHQAIHKLGFECVFASDIDENCRKTYETNYGLKTHGDITKINISEIPNFDILCGGFPCQPFSKAGFQKGFNDNRGNLFFNICDIVKEHKPKYIILENVRNLASHDNGNTWSVIKKHMDELGYYTYSNPVLLNVLHFNIPQNRERVVIMCKRKDLGGLPKLPKISKYPKQELTTFVKDIIDHNVKEVKLTDKMKDVYLVWNNFIEIMNNHNLDIPKFPIWTDWWDNEFEENDEFYVKYKSWIDKNRDFYAQNFNILDDWLINSRQNKNWVGAVRKFEWQAGTLNEDNNSLNKCLWTARGSGIRVKKCDYIPTLVAMSMIPVYGPKNRKLTPTELLRLQSFNDSFKYDEKHIYKQLGNAVNVTMIEKCARFLLYGENLFS